MIVMIILVLPGCEVFGAPFALLSELIPLAIKYAPYALMFLEEQDLQNPIYTDANQFQQNISPLAHSFEPTLQLESIATALENEVPQHQGKLRYVVAIHLNDTAKVERIQNWLLSQNKKFKVTYRIAAYNENDLQESQNIAQFVAKNSMLFFADGPLNHLTTAEIECCHPFLQNR